MNRVVIVVRDIDGEVIAETVEGGSVPESAQEELNNGSAHFMALFDGQWRTFNQE
jgi:hypothetical protein